MKRLFPVLLLALLLFGSLQDSARAASTPPEKTASGSPGENPNKHATFNPVLTIQLQRDAAMWGDGTVLDVDVGPNLYAYVRQNPWTAFDPLGLDDKKGPKKNSTEYWKERKPEGVDLDKPWHEQSSAYAKFWKLGYEFQQSIEKGSQRNIVEEGQANAGWDDPDIPRKKGESYSQWADRKAAYLVEKGLAGAKDMATSPEAKELYEVGIAAFIAGKVPGPKAPKNTVIGKWDPKTNDIRGLQPGENSLLKHLPDQGSPKLNWKQNSRALRTEMNKGRPLRDAHVDNAGNLLPGSPDGVSKFIDAERNLLRNHGWTYDPKSTLWSPPTP